MPMTPEERRAFQVEMGKLGITGDLLDSWPPKQNWWRHIPQMNNRGKAVKPAGTAAPNQPGHPDTTQRLARRGLLPWQPSSDCKCRGCRERDWAKTVVDAEGLLYGDTGDVPLPEGFAEGSMTVAPPAQEQTQPQAMCPECGWNVPANKRAGDAMKLHNRTKHGPRSKRGVARLTERLAPPPEPKTKDGRPACPDCDFVVPAHKKDPAISLRTHRRWHQRKAMEKEAVPA